MLEENGKRYTRPPITAEVPLRRTDTIPLDVYYQRKEAEKQADKVLEERAKKNRIYHLLAAPTKEVKVSIRGRHKKIPKDIKLVTSNY